MITGAREAGALPLPGGVDLVTVPSIQKTDTGGYRSRRLDAGLLEVIEIRRRIAESALDAFRPDVLIVDTEPRGAFQELEPALAALRRRGKTRCVLGMRDIRDEPGTVKREWKIAATEAAIHEYYDEVWVYGDRAVFDVAREYDLSADVAAKLRYTGYLDQRVRLDLVHPNDESARLLKDLPSGRLMLCTLGGGQDGAHVGRAFVEAALPPDAFGVVLAGSQMSREALDDLNRCAECHGARMRVLRFVSEPAPLLARADRLVSMGGYNSTLEAVSFGIPALVVPRVKPRQEQWIRANRLRAMGLVDVVHPDCLSREVITEWLGRDTRPRARRDCVDLGGLRRVTQFLSEPQGARVVLT